MECPIDGETLLMTSREGVEIDYCPKCRGVWLDRGELDKIIERSDAGSAHPASTMRGRSRDHDMDDDDDDDDHFKKRDHKERREKYRSKDRDKDRARKKSDKPGFYKKSKKHASFIKELFDF